MVSNEVINLAIKPNQVIELEYFNPELDGLNNISIKVTNDMITIIAYDDEANEILIKALPFYQLLESGTDIFNAKKQYLKSYLIGIR